MNKEELEKIKKVKANAIFRDVLKKGMKRLVKEFEEKYNVKVAY